MVYDFGPDMPRVADGSPLLIHDAAHFYDILAVSAQSSRSQ